MRRIDRATWLVVGAVGCLMLMFVGTLTLDRADAQQVNGTAASSEPTNRPSVGDRINALETQVAVLQTQVAELQDQSDPDSAPSGAAATEPTHTITFTLDLTGSDHFIGAGIGKSCFGTGGYDDIGPGMAVIIFDQSETVIGTAFADRSEQMSRSVCRVYATIENVPEVPFYQIQASHRGAPSYSLQQMEQRDWTIALSIGD